MTTKTCSKCKEEKSIECFSNDKNRKDGLYPQCKDCVKESSHKRYLNNKEEINIKAKAWKVANKEYYLGQQREYRKEYQQTPRGKFREYKSGATERGLPFEITLEQFVEYWQLPCYYCGRDIETIGLDRIDNSLGYTIDNITTCCSQCNRAKDTMPQSEFIELCKLIASRFPDVAE